MRPDHKSTGPMVNLYEMAEFSACDAGVEDNRHAQSERYGQVEGVLEA